MFRCPVCLGEITHWAPGPNNRSDAACPNCGALERHRFVAVILKTDGDSFCKDACLDVAPSECLRSTFDALFDSVVRMDANPGADRRRVDVVDDIQSTRLADCQFDFIYCSHVLAHVVSDELAIAEIHRLLVPGGRALVQVPYRSDRATDEDPYVLEDERIARFGQHDHVRSYGHDIHQRFASAGFVVQEVFAHNYLDAKSLQACGIPQDEIAWILHKYFT